MPAEIKCKRIRLTLPLTARTVDSMGASLHISCGLCKDTSKSCGLKMLCEVGAECLTSKEVLQHLVAVDEEIEVLKKALCPFVRGVPVTPDMDDATIEKMIDLKCNLEEQRKKAAALVHDLLARERSDPHRVRKIMRDRRQNAEALHAGLSLLSEYEQLRA